MFDRTLANLKHHEELALIDNDMQTIDSRIFKLCKENSS